MALIYSLIARFAGKSVWATRLAGRLVSDPLGYLVGKPLSQWYLVYDLPRQKVALANDPEIVEVVMQDRAGTFPKATALYHMLRPLVGEGLFGQPGGPEIRPTRRIFTGAINQVPRERIAAVTGELVDKYIDRWLTESGAREVQICREMSRLTVDIVSLCTMGTTFDTAESEEFTDLFFDYHKRCLPVVMLLAEEAERTPEKVIANMGLTEVGARMRELMRQRFIAPLEAGDPAVVGSPFAQALLKAGILRAEGDRLTGSGDDLKRALDEFSVMLLAGHETTASTMSWLFWELANRTEMQETIGALLAAAGAGNQHARAPTGELWRRATSEELVLALTQEALRLYPPIAFYMRESTNECAFRDKTVPAGSVVVVAPWTLHRHTRLWKDPDDFWPGRWIRHRHSPPRTSYMPFGIGPRTCPGALFADAEMRVIVRKLLTRFRIFPARQGQRPKPLGTLTARPDREIVLSLEPRPQPPRVQRRQPVPRPVARPAVAGRPQPAVQAPAVPDPAATPASAEPTAGCPFHHDGRPPGATAGNKT